MLQSLLSITVAFTMTGYLAFLLRRKGEGLFRPLPMLLVALSFIEISDLMAVRHPDDFLFWKKLAICAEGVLPGLWLLLSLTLNRANEMRGMQRAQRAFLLFSPAFIVAAAVVPIEKYFFSPDFAAERTLFLSMAGFAFYVGLLFFLVVALTNMELTLANASRGARWKIKFEILGAGSIAAVLLFYYSHGLLYRSLDMNLLPLRSMVIIVGIGLMTHSGVKRNDGVKISLSRQMAFRSLVLIAVGVYLLWLGVVGEWIKHAGNPEIRPIVVSLLFITGLALLMFLLSESMRRRMKIFIHKNFYANKYDYRTQWLMFTDRLASSKSDLDLMRAILSGFCETFGMKGALLFLDEGEKEPFRQVVEHEMKPVLTTFSRESGLIRCMESRRGIYLTRDRAPELSIEENTFILANSVSFTVPLFRNGAMFGFIALGPSVVANEQYGFEDIDLMKTLAHQAASAVLNLRLSEELSKAREMEALGKISAFVLHDLKNLVSTLALLLDNAREFMSNPEFQDDMLQSLASTVEKMKRLISRLKKLEEKGALQRQAADLLELSREATRPIAIGEINVIGTHIESAVDVEEIQKVILNLVLNAIEATGGSGPVTIEIGEEQVPFIRISDKGCGMSADFINKHLFKPFRTTKRKGLGIGLYQCKQIMSAHGGKIEVESEPGRGSVFTLYFPISEVWPHFTAAETAVQ